MKQQLVPSRCECGFGKIPTAWHCKCGRWKPSLALVCEVCSGEVMPLPPHVRHRLTPYELRTVRTRIKAGDNLHSVAREFGVAHQTIWNIAHGYSWRNVA